MNTKNLIESSTLTMKGANSTLDLILSSMEDEIFPEEAPEPSQAILFYKRVPEYLEALRFLSGQYGAVAERLEKAAQAVAGQE